MSKCEWSTYDWMVKKNYKRWQIYSIATNQLVSKVVKRFQQRKSVVAAKSSGRPKKISSRVDIWSNERRFLIRNCPLIRWKHALGLQMCPIGLYSVASAILAYTGDVLRRNRWSRLRIDCYVWSSLRSISIGHPISDVRYCGATNQSSICSLRMG